MKPPKPTRKSHPGKKWVCLKAQIVSSDGMPVNGDGEEYGTDWEDCWEWVWRERKEYGCCDLDRATHKLNEFATHECVNWKPLPRPLTGTILDAATPRHRGRLQQYL